MGARRRVRGNAGAFVAVGVLALSGCVGAPEEANGEVSAYVDRAIAEMRDGIHVDSDAFRAAVAAAAPDLRAQRSIVRTYPGLRELATVAGGEHSSFLSPVEVQAATSADVPGATFPVPTASTDAGVTVLTLPSFTGQSASAVQRYERSGLDALRATAAETTCGWIVDLRTNGGGNAWPMLAVAAPLLDDGTVVGLRRGEETRWAEVLDGGVVSTPGGEDTTTPGGFTLDGPVAILTSTMTASAAEIVALAFIGQDDVIRVGAPTAGLTTGNEIRELSDGAWIVLTTTYDVDRTGRVYDGPIAPDILAPPGSTPSDLDVARSELASRCG